MIDNYRYFLRSTKRIDNYGSLLIIIAHDRALNGGSTNHLVLWYWSWISAFLKTHKHKLTRNKILQMIFFWWFFKNFHEEKCTCFSMRNKIFCKFFNDRVLESNIISIFKNPQQAILQKVKFFKTLLSSNHLVLWYCF